MITEKCVLTFVMLVESRQASNSSTKTPIYTGCAIVATSYYNDE